MLHAAWNLLIKTSDERFLTAWGQFLVGGVLFLPVLLVIGLPPSAAVPYLVASSIVHVVYIGALVRAYHHGDFSFAYPLARGGGALLAAIGGVVVPLGRCSRRGVGRDRDRRGRARLARPSARRAARARVGGAHRAHDRRLHDARHRRRAPADSGLGYGIVLVIGSGAAMSVVGVARGRGRELVAHVRSKAGPRVLAGGVATVVAYSMVLAAVRLAPVGYVAALRESSVVLGAAAGWLLLHERLGRARVVSSRWSPPAWPS